MSESLKHRFCFRVYRSAASLSRRLENMGAHRLADAVYRLLPVKLCHISMTENELPAEATGQPSADIAPQGQGRPAAPVRKPKRLPRQSIYRPPEGAKPMPGTMPGMGPSVVPVSSVARDMGISARRVRVMLAEGRLAGHQKENGYWEVFYPYRYILGTRGPALTRQRNLPEPVPRIGNGIRNGGERPFDN